MELNRDELRRQIRAIDRAQRDSEADQRLLIDAIVDEVPEGRRGLLFMPNLDRRSFLRVGGLTVGATTLLAACRKKNPKAQMPIAGQNPGYKAPTDKPVTDLVLLRTAASFEYSMIDAYRRMVDNKFAMDPAVSDLLKMFSDHHAAHAAAMGDAAKALGGTACSGLNPKITAYLIEPLLARIGQSKGDQAEDVKAFAYALESVAAGTYQSFVPTLTQPSLRAAAMSVGAVEAKHAAVLAVLINPSALIPVPGGAAAAPPATPTSAGGGPTTTVVQLATAANAINAVPSAFGSLAPIPLTVGPANENGVRIATNLETPSLNSYLYEDEAC